MKKYRPRLYDGRYFTFTVFLVFFKKKQKSCGLLHDVSATIPAISSAKLNNSKRINGCDDRIAEFFEKDGEAYVSTLEKIYTIAEYFKKCGSENWAAYQNGIVPYCF